MADGGRRHGTTGAAQVALTVLVVGGTALGALLLHPGTSPVAQGRGPLGGNAGWVGCVLLSLLGGFALRESYLKQVGARQDLTPVEQRLADGTGRVLLAAPLVVALLVLMLHRFGAPDGGHTHHGSVTRPATRTPDVRNLGDGPTLEWTRVLSVLSFLLLAVVVAAAGVYLWRYLTRPAWPEDPSTYAAHEDEPERLAQVVDDARRVLLEGTDARSAVIACYVAMEKSLADSGTARRASDTPQDLLERAVVGGEDARAAAAELTALFREARYSTHPMDDGHRDRAGAALAEIAHDLRSRARGSHTVAGDA